MSAHYTDAELLAASDALREWNDDWSITETQAEHVLDAVAPAIAARALREAAEAVDEDFRLNVNGVALDDAQDEILCARAFGMYRASRSLRTRADEIERTP